MALNNGQVKDDCVSIIDIVIAPGKYFLPSRVKKFT
jgi:hypothetical protein